MPVRVGRQRPFSQVLQAAQPSMTTSSVSLKRGEVAQEVLINFDSTGVRSMPPAVGRDSDAEVPPEAGSSCLRLDDEDEETRDCGDRLLRPRL